MFGGKLEMGSGNVTDELWVFNMQSKSWAQQSPSTPAHGQVYAVEGHSAHIAELDTGDVVMVVIFGYSSIYSYISNVQEYNISECVTDLMFNSTEGGSNRYQQCSEVQVQSPSKMCEQTLSGQLYV